MFKRFLRGNLNGSIQRTLNGSIQRTLNAMSDAMMIVDRDLKVTYANKAFDTLVSHQAELFKAHFPHLNPAKIVGSRIDTLHSKLAGQRTLLANPTNLPFVIDITLGSMTLNVSMTATYNAIGRCSGYVVQWRDVTAQWENEERMSAIDRSQGRIELGMDGKVITANQIFLDFLGYTLQEAVGQHHSSFVTADYAKSQDYKDFWAKLNRGEYIFGPIHRVGKGGKDVWLQAIYNPICDANGKPYKVVKYATDITAQYQTAHTLEVAVEETKQVIELAKSGDLTSRVPLEGKAGAIASLCDGVNALMDNMTEVLLSVREAGETINTAASEISTGNIDLSSRTEQQAASLEETASSMEQIASTVKQNADNAKQANQMAALASKVAIKGGAAVSDVVATMSDINQSARKIEDIIAVIDGIAFQTNILALNAAVEAARAGEQGRGFAVVAGEVRNLAQRSANAAKEIKALIADSAHKTAEGSKLVESAGATMQELVISVQHVTEIMREITHSSEEQSAGIEQVNVAITSIDEFTQQNAALVEQAAAASESLVEQAIHLMDSVNRYKLRGLPSQQLTPKRSQEPAYAPPAKTVAVFSKANAQTVSHEYKRSTRTGTDNHDWAEF